MLGPLGVDDSQARAGYCVPPPQGDAGPARGDEGRIDQSIENLTEEPVREGVSSRDTAGIEVVAPFDFMDRLRDFQGDEGLRAGEIRQAGLFQDESHDGRGMLNEALVVLGLGRREFTRGIEAKYALRIPTSTETGSPYTELRTVCPARDVGPPQNQPSRQIIVRH